MDTESGMGMRARKIADGRCVKTIVWILPIRFAMEEARSMDIAAMIAVVKKREPRTPSLRWNFSWKKNVTQELDLISYCSRDRNQ